MKRAKRASIKYTTSEYQVANIICPHCKTHIQDHSFSELTTRFLCLHCKNEIIVDQEATHEP